jgi:hypothetical protein
VYKTECNYDPTAAEMSQKQGVPTSLKRSNSVVQEPTSAEYLVQQLLILPETGAIDAIHQLRLTGDIDAIAEALRKNVKISESLTEPLTAEIDQAHIKGDVAVDQRYRYGFSSGLGLVPTDEFDITKPQHRPTSQLWTDVTADGDLVNHLMKLYFTWTNHCYPLVSEKEFYDDFVNGKTEACSTLLVNAICASGSLWTDDPRARQDPNDPQTAGDHFYRRARRLLFEDEVTPRLTTVQALQILSMREASASRISNGFRYAGWALTMAVELGMHLEGWKTTPNEDGMRRRSFWAMFNCDT